MDEKSFLGKEIGNYRITADINSGAYGSVYKAEHIHLKGRIVAIKFLHTYIASAKEREQFLQEAQFLALLEHPHILPVFDFGFHEGLPYLISGYAAGGSLRNVLQPEKPFPLEKAVTLLIQLGQALHYAHQQNIIHRDLKPENILFNAQGDVLLADFGIATMLSTASMKHLTTIGGTPAYMAPEQFQGIISKQGDQYALGCIAYELVTGYRPFTAPDFLSMGFKHLTEQPVAPTRYNPQVPEAIEAAILKALAKQRTERHPDIPSFVAVLQRPFVKEEQRRLTEQARLAEEMIHLPKAEAQKLNTLSPASQEEEKKPRSATSSNPIMHSPSASHTEMSPAEVVTPDSPSFVTTHPMDKLQLPQQRISRRAAVLTLTGLAGIGIGIASGALIWSTHLQPPSIPHTVITQTPTLETTLYTYHSREGGAYAVAWSPDGKSLASASDFGTVQIWNATNGQVSFTYQHPAAAAIGSIAWSPNGKLIAFSGLGDNAVDIWDANTGNHVFTYRSLTGGAFTVAWSPDSQLIASGNHTVEVWKATTGEHIYTYPGVSGSGNLTGVKWSPDGKRIVSGYLGNVALVWDATSGEHVLISSGYSKGVLDVAWSPNGQFIASGVGDATARVWNATTGDRIYTYTGHSKAVESVAWSPNGKRIASASDDGTVHIWDTTTGNHVYIYKGHSGFVSRAFWSPDGGRIASVGSDNTVQVWVAQ